MSALMPEPKPTVGARWVCRLLGHKTRIDLAAMLFGKERCLRCGEIIHDL